MIEGLPQSILFYVAAFASVVGLVIYYLYYRGFIQDNYRHVKWFRRLVAPHLSVLLRRADKETPDTDLSRLYVETELSEEECVYSLSVEAENKDDTLDKIEDVLSSLHLRPEVVLTSVASDEEGNYAIANWVLTGPSKSKSDVRGVGVLYEILHLLVSKWQLHLRIVYKDGLLKFYVHKEYNPYNPLFAKKHFVGKDIDIEEAKTYFRENIQKEIEEELP